MMKQSLCKLTALRALLPFVITMLAAVQAAAADYDYQVGVLYYKVLGESTNVEVVAPPSGKYSGDIVVPASFKIGNVTYTVTAIGDNAFQAATVTSVKLPAEGITKIGGWAFNDCTGLTSFVLPASITSIGQRAFYCCDKLQHLWAEASDPAKYNVASEAFSSINRSGNTCTIHAPIGQAATYQNSDAFKDKKFAFAECVFINSTTFPDKNFRNYILAQDYGEDIVLTEEEIAAVTEISVPSMDIIKLQGLEFFTALKILDCSGNILSSINVEKNTVLTDLDCSNSNLSSINVGKNTALTDLDCSSNDLSMSGLDINNNTELGILICDNCGLTKLDVSKNTNLKRISCCQNQLTSLDLSKNIALMNLYCRGNKISGNDMDDLVKSLPSGIGNNLYVCGNDENEGNEMTTMQVAAAETKGWTAKMYDGANWVDYAGAQVMAIDEAHFPDANFRKWLLAQNYGKDGYLSEKEIAGIGMIEVNEKSIADLTGIEYFTALTTLSCYGNLLTKLDVSKNKALDELQCDKNQLTELDVSNNTKLDFLTFSYNQLTTLDLSKNLSIKGFLCFDNQIRGKGMEDLVKNLPPVSNAMLVVSYISEPATGNKMTTAQVAAAKAKGWTILMLDGGENLVDYAGITPGDANSDGVVNVADIVAVVRHKMGSDVTGFSIPAADMNDDGKADKDDIPLIQKIIMKK